MRKRATASALGALVLATVLVLLPPPSAGAQTMGSVTLQASASTIAYGSALDLTGTIVPPAGGQSVRIVDQDGSDLASATTHADGSFEASMSPEASTTLQADWNGARSDPVAIRVRAALSVGIGRVRLFDPVVARGSVAPALDGTTVRVSLILAGRVVARREVAATAAGAFRARLPIRQPGTYRVRATSAPSGLSLGTASAGPASTPLPTLRPGSTGAYVRALERRLVALHYRLTAVNSRYDLHTADAVVAFRKVQGMTRTGTVDAAVWRRLADPRIPKPRSTAKAFHIEVDQAHQVLYTVQAGSITNIIHVSTGANGATRDGSFRVYRKLAGFSPNHLYYPSYFDGLRAIHGWTDVPTYPASHGCVRVPYWNATWIYGLAAIGTRVIVYH